jgi:hypothetical protein
MKNLHAAVTTSVGLRVELVGFMVEPVGSYSSFTVLHDSLPRSLLSAQNAAGVEFIERLNGRDQV